MGIESKLEELSRAKIASIEALQREERLKREILDLVGYHEERAHSVVINDRWKVTTQGRINRTIDTRQWESVEQKIPEGIAKRVVKLKPSLNLRELRFIQNNEPELYRIIATAITAKPGKPSLTVEELF